MGEHTVITEISNEGIATVTLNRAEKHNAFDDAIIADLHSAFTAIAQRSDVRVMILASAGKSFSAGADLSWMKRMAEYDYGHNLEDAQQLASMLRALHTMPMPTIARVQGAAFGGAVGLVSCCDMAVATPRASFSLSEVRIGLIPATISPYVIAAIGDRFARRYFMTGERFSAEQALLSGLISELVDENELDQRVASLAKQILSNGPQAVRAAKDLVQCVSGEPISDALIANTCARIAHIRVSEEGQEGLGAFLEKRQPAWSPREN